jgi:hypothetical protein
MQKNVIAIQQTPWVNLGVRTRTTKFGEQRMFVRVFIMLSSTQTITLPAV